MTNEKIETVVLCCEVCQREVRVPSYRTPRAEVARLCGVDDEAHRAFVERNAPETNATGRVLRWLSEVTNDAAPDRVREVLTKTLAERAGLVRDLERRARCHAIAGLALDVLNQRAHQQDSRVLRETAALVEMLEDASKVAGVSGHYAAALLFALEADPYRIVGPLCSFAAHLDLDPIDGVLGIGRVDFQEEPRARPAAAPSVPSLDWTRPYRLVADALAVGVPVAQLAHDAERLLDACQSRYGRCEGFAGADALLRAALALRGGPAVGFTSEQEAERMAGALVVEAVGALEATCAEIEGGRVSTSDDFAHLSEEHFGDTLATFGVGEALDTMARSRELRAANRRELGRAREAA